MPEPATSKPKLSDPQWLAKIDAARANLEAAREALKPFEPPPGAVGLSDYALDPQSGHGKAVRSFYKARNAYDAAVNEALNGEAGFLATTRAAALAKAKAAVTAAREQRAAALRAGGSDADIDKLDTALALARRAEERTASMQVVQDSPQQQERRRILWERFWAAYVQAQTTFRVTIAAALLEQAALQIMLGDAEVIFGRRLAAETVYPADLIDAHRVHDFAARDDTRIAAANRVERAA